MIPRQADEQKRNIRPVLIIMGKAPIAGRCKTRLAPRLGLRGAAKLQSQLLRQRLQLASTYPGKVEIHVAPDSRHPIFLRAKRLGLKVRKQVSGNLGRRMQQAQGQRSVIIIGTDCPALKQAHIQQAYELLKSQQPSCIPANDGGYVLIALPKAEALVFQTIDWGTSKVLQQTRKQQRRSQLRWHFNSALDDLDSPRDYKKQRRAKLIRAY